MRIILAVGAILAALAYVGPTALRARPRWGANRAAADLEANQAMVQAKLADDASRRAEEFRMEGRVSEAEQQAKEAEAYRQKEAFHLRRSQEFLRRWW